MIGKMLIAGSLDRSDVPASWPRKPNRPKL